MDPRSATNGKPWLLTRASDDGRESKALDYLLPNGRRHRVWISQAHDSEEMRNLIGDALGLGRTGIVKAK